MAVDSYLVVSIAVSVGSAALVIAGTLFAHVVWDRRSRS